MSLSCSTFLLRTTFFRAACRCLRRNRSSHWTAVIDDAMISSGFVKETYIGAFAQDDERLVEWTEFDPQNRGY